MSTINNTNNLIKLVPFESKFGFFEVFSDKSIQKGYHSVNHHNLDRKYKAKIPLPIIETMTVDNGQFTSWVFTDNSGFVMKRSQNKINRESIMLYLIGLVRDFFLNTEGVKFKKQDAQILWDISRFTSTVIENPVETKRLFADSETKYLEKFYNLKFLLVYFYRGENKSPDKKFENVFEFNLMLNDNNILSEASIVQIFLHANFKVKPLICKYSRKDFFSPKKFQLFTDKPFNNNSNIQGLLKQPSLLITESEDDVNKESIMILLNDNNLCAAIETTLEPFIKLAERSKNLIITEAFFKFVKVKDGYSYDQSEISFKTNKKENESYKFAYCSKVIAQRKSDPEYLAYELDKQEKLNRIKEKTIPRDLLYPKPKPEKIFNNSDNKAISSESEQKKFKMYEKVSKEAFCFGEFCEYLVPKFFKNLKKNSKMDEMDSSGIPKENKFSERDRCHNLPNSLPVFLIKKAYDNPNLVNIVLKAYSIFPKDFDKDAALRERNRIKKEEEDRLKEDEKETLLSKRNSIHNAYLPSIRTITVTESKLPSLHTPVAEVTSVNNATTSTDSDAREIKVPEGKTANTLYYPTPHKFESLNHDVVYSRKGVCSNCFTIYSLIHTFLSNIDQSTSQFKSISKARDLLMQGDQMKKASDKNEDSIDQNEPENILFEEERRDFNLKSILKRNLRKMKREEIKKNEKRKGKVKIFKNNKNRKDEFKQDFSYNLNVNSKLLKLNLIAEKTKNKFFNLIFSELRSGPDTIYQKLDVKKEDKKHFNKSMTNLRMHMGINSYSYNTNAEDLGKLNKKINDEAFKDRLSARDSEIKENTNQSKVSSAYNSNGSLSPGKFFGKSIDRKDILMNQQSESNQIDVDIFLAYKNLNKNECYVSPFGSTSNDKYNFLMEEQDEKDSIISNKEEQNEEKFEDEEFEDDEDDEDKEFLEIEDEDDDISNLEEEIRDKVTNVKEFEEYNDNDNFLGKKNSAINYVKMEQIKTSAQQDNREKTLGYRNSKRQEGNELDQIKDKTQPSNKSNFNNEISKKITVSSIFYYEWLKDYNKIDSGNHYYYITTPLTKINEMNIPVQENPLILTQNISSENFIKIGKFQQSPLLKGSEIFVYDQNTAVPFKLITLKGELKDKVEVNKSYKRKVTSSRRISSLSSAALREAKSPKFIIVVLNDFFDSFIKYQDIMTNVWSCYAESVEKLKMLFFNFPGQSSTLFSKKAILNNTYYTEFLDRFFFYLVDNLYFDHSYSIIFVGFGNGGQIALSFSSAYEKYWDFLHSILLFNPLCENDDFINKSFLDLLKIIESSKNTKLIDFFVKSITVNPQKLLDLDNKLLQLKNFDSTRERDTDHKDSSNFSELNPITITGYHNITRGYFFNLKINHKEIQTPIIVVHSNQNCFITINNTNSIFYHVKTKIFSVTKGRKESSREGRVTKDLFETNLFKFKQPAVTCKYDFDELEENKIKRKFIVVDGSHDIVLDNETHISNIIHSYMKSVLKNINANK